MRAVEIAHGLIDAEGRLAEAEDALLGLVMRAGGGLGRTVAVPQLATLARLARRLGVPIAREVVVADKEADIELTVRARAEGETVRLTVGGWRERQPWRPADGPTELDLLRAESDWRWESDAALRLVFLSIESGARDGFDTVGCFGRPLTDLFSFEPDAQGGLPILEALAGRRSFSGQPAKLRPSGRRVLVSALARRDADGAFAGFEGGACYLDRPRPEPSATPPPPVVGMGDRLERALRAPISRIVADADGIRNASDRPIGPYYAAYAADIAGAGRHLMALVDDLADLDSVERPGFAPALESVDLAELARRAAGLLSVRAADMGMTIARPASEARAPALGDERRVLQILVNLVGNAMRHSPPGGTVVVAAGPGPHVTVSDEGEGIARQDQERIFAKFERLNPSEPGGSGLGLYIARRLARAMGGDLTVESAPGRGAKFTLSLRAER